MALITFQDLPNTTTPLNSTNLNNNFTELNNNKVSKSGDTMTGDLTVNRGDNDTTITVGDSSYSKTNQTYYQNSGLEVGVGIDNSGSFRMWDYTHSKKIISDDTSGNIEFNGKVLYDTLYSDSTGNNGSFDINGNFGNYDYVEIMFRNNDNNYNCVRIYDPNGKRVVLQASNNNSTNTWVKTKVVSLNNGRVNSETDGTEVVIGNNQSTSGGGNYIWITKIVGYK